MKEVLICGARAFVGKGLAQMLESKGYQVDLFSRGKEGRTGNVVYGDYAKIASNPFLKESYGYVINLAVIKDGTRDSNVDYIKSLTAFCSNHGVNKLIHFSTIMNYSYHLQTVTEDSPIETLDETDKKGYAEFKIAADQFLISVRDELPFEVVFVRPGYVLADNRPCPFIKRLPLGLSVIKGNRKSRQPIVRREDIHEALLKIIETKHNDKVYHFFPNNGMTKYRYAKETVCGIILTMPKWLFKGIPCLMSKMGIISKALYSRFDGMYIESDFDSSKTEQNLNIKFR